MVLQTPIEADHPTTKKIIETGEKIIQSGEEEVKKSPDANAEASQQNDEIAKENVIQQDVMPAGEEGDKKE